MDPDRIRTFLPQDESSWWSSDPVLGGNPAEPHQGLPGMFEPFLFLLSTDLCVCVYIARLHGGESPFSVAQLVLIGRFSSTKLSWFWRSRCPTCLSKTVCPLVSLRHWTDRVKGQVVFGPRTRTLTLLGWFRVSRWFWVGPGPGAAGRAGSACRHGQEMKAGRCLWAGNQQTDWLWTGPLAAEPDRNTDRKPARTEPNQVLKQSGI